MFKRFGKMIALILFVAATASPAHALYEVRSSDFYTGGAITQSAGASWGGGYAYGTGQWPPEDYVDMTPLYVSNIYNWGGSQPLGFSYMPPIGLSAIGNSAGFGSLGYGITPYTFRDTSGGSYSDLRYGYGSGRAF